MRPDKILFIDTETGGLDYEHDSLLSIGLVIWQDFRILDSIEIAINDGILSVSKQALDVNKINLTEHKAKALNSKQAIDRFTNFLAAHFGANEKITLAGHNINFDINFLRHFLLKNKFEWHQRFSHRVIDTASILYFLYFAEQLENKSISSDDAFRLFGITVSKRHSALGDAVATANLFSKLLRVMMKNNSLNSKQSPYEQLNN